LQDRARRRADFIHLWRWRKSVEQAEGLTVVSTAIVSGLLGALWFGIKLSVGKTS
jgi:hypothetical protein